MSNSLSHAVQQLFAPLKAAQEQEYIGEPISQLEHALQCAYWAQKAQAPDEVILAALFHDLGHLVASHDTPQMDGLGVLKHEQVGAQYLQRWGTSSRLADLVLRHVDAKRYLCYKNPNYLNRLSSASLGTLRWQGGPMDAQEAQNFSQLSDHKYILALRSWDERAKDPHFQAPGLGDYRPLLEQHLRWVKEHQC